MTRHEANKYLKAAGFPGLEVDKADGIWYLVGDDGVVNQAAERCLHVVRLSDLDESTLRWKLNELTNS